MNKCDGCGCPLPDNDFNKLGDDKYCGRCWDEMHQPQIDDFSDADPGL